MTSCTIGSQGGGNSLIRTRVVTKTPTLTDDARLAAAAVAGARAVSVSAVEGEGPIVWESIVSVGRPMGS